MLERVWTGPWAQGKNLKAGSSNTCGKARSPQARQTFIETTLWNGAQAPVYELKEPHPGEPEGGAAFRGLDQQGYCHRRTPAAGPMLEPVKSVTV